MHMRFDHDIGSNYECDYFLYRYNGTFWYGPTSRRAYAVKPGTPHVLLMMRTPRLNAAWSLSDIRASASGSKYVTMTVARDKSASCKSACSTWTLSCNWYRMIFLWNLAIKWSSISIPTAEAPCFRAAAMQMRPSPHPKSNTTWRCFCVHYELISGNTSLL